MYIGDCAYTVNLVYSAFFIFGHVGDSNNTLVTRKFLTHTRIADMEDTIV